MQKTESYGKVIVERFLFPGQYLNDIELEQLQKNITYINNDRINHALISVNNSLEQFREMTKHMVIALTSYKEKYNGFIFCPVLKSPINDTYIFHAGLIVMNRNYLGNNAISILGAGNAFFVYKHLKVRSFFSTNITSTPSIVESFSKFGGKNIWPSPNANLRTPNKHYRSILRTLKKEYINVFFPKNETITVDEKRFILRSSSQEMGFNTSFDSIPKADSLKYNLFCKLWINYKKQEDVIQIGEFSLRSFLKVWIYLKFLRYKIK
ncbi:MULTISPECIES: hypothetical protein [Flammeovirga]|uniref:Uncharacterized protein n=1 Tax=Flammeovirga agarivorans TaxID=2726742 RepID=A0A7X8SJB1_9BACT|nr:MULTISPECIES: hypothetical protein [Flammeovirga]NLR91225.1 hypothetical protein [Flammeovirga agarivorans]